MATEASDADMAKKKSKHKKNKGYTDNNTKKRKREEQQAEANGDDAQVEQPTKKHKKDKHNTLLAVQPMDSSKSLLEQHSPFVKQTTSFYLALSPCAYDFAIEGLCAEHISPLLLTYVPPLKGVLLSYENPRIAEHPSGSVQINGITDERAVLTRSIDEYGVTYVWLTAEFTVFKPRRGTYLEGIVHIQNESMLGLVCYNYFNAVTERDKLPEDWKWIENGEETANGQRKQQYAIQGAGYYVDGEGNNIEEKLVFRVEDFEANTGSDGGPGIVSIMGSLRFDSDET